MFASATVILEPVQQASSDFPTKTIELSDGSDPTILGKEGGPFQAVCQPGNGYFPSFEPPKTGSRTLKAFHARLRYDAAQSKVFIENDADHYGSWVFRNVPEGVDFVPLGHDSGKQTPSYELIALDTVGAKTDLRTGDIIQLGWRQPEPSANSPSRASHLPVCARVTVTLPI